MHTNIIRSSQTTCFSMNFSRNCTRVDIEDTQGRIFVLYVLDNLGQAKIRCSIRRETVDIREMASP